MHRKGCHPRIGSRGGAPERNGRRTEARGEYEAAGGTLGRQRIGDDTPGKNTVAYVPALASYLADESVLAIARGALDPQVRIAQIEFKFRPANDDNPDYRSYHSDWPHDLKDADLAGTHPPAFPGRDHRPF